MVMFALRDVLFQNPIWTSITSVGMFTNLLSATSLESLKGDVNFSFPQNLVKSMQVSVFQHFRVSRGVLDSFVFLKPG